MRKPWAWSYPEALLVGLSVTVLLALIVVASTSTAAFGLYNTQWDGSAEIRSITEDGGATYEVVQSTTAYDRHAPEETFAFILSPNQAYSGEEIERIRSFVDAGGTLLVAVDFGGEGNTLLDEVGADARVAGTLLRDEQHLFESPTMPVATNVTNTSWTTGLDDVTLNHGSPVEPGDATVLVRTAPSAYVDLNRNGELDDSETPREWPVVTAEAVGDGQVIVVGDPSVFINAMLEREGNRQFVRSLTDEDDVVLLDTSHTTGIPPLVAGLTALRESAALQVLLGVLLVGFVAVLTSKPLDVYRGRFGDREAVRFTLSEDDLRDVLEDEHPEWDTERIERIVKGVTRQRENEQEDD